MKKIILASKVYTGYPLQNLFFLCLGLFIGTTFCMKWMESYFIKDGQLFTIIGLEITYSKEKVVVILSGLDEKVKTLLRFHLIFDFAFMAGVYPGIATLCFMVRKNSTGRHIKNILYVLGVIQVFAWSADIFENLYLLHWIKHPVIGKEFTFYHVVVYAKWVIAICGVIAVMLTFGFMKKQVLKTDFLI